jgi:hypothetical protein
VVGFAGETPGLLVWLAHPGLIAYAAASTVVIQVGRESLGESAVGG